MYGILALALGLAIWSRLKKWHKNDSLQTKALMTTAYAEKDDAKALLLFNEIIDKCKGSADLIAQGDVAEKNKIYGEMTRKFKSHPDDRVKEFALRAQLEKARISTDKAEKIVLYDSVIADYPLEKLGGMNGHIEMAIREKAKVTGDSSELSAYYNKIIDGCGRDYDITTVPSLFE